MVRRACGLGYIDEAIFRKYYLPQYLFILGSSLYCLGLYLIALYGVDAQLMPKDI